MMHILNFGHYISLYVWSGNMFCLEHDIELFSYLSCSHRSCNNHVVIFILFVTARIYFPDVSGSRKSADLHSCVKIVGVIGSGNVYLETK
jgi:hypothetical protein